MYFFTEPNKLQTQTQAQAFGTIDINSYRLGNMFTASSSPKAFAITGGNILVQDVNGNSNLVNIVLKPFNQPELGFPKILYFIYKGILKSSLVNTNGVVAAQTNNDLTRKIWESYNLQFEKLNTPNLSPPSSPLANEILGTKYNATANGEYLTIDSDSLSIPFHHVIQPLFTVSEGDHIGDFDSSNIGIIIVTEKIGYNPPFLLARELDSRILFSPLPITPTNAQNFNRKHQKEDVLSFIDASAFFGSFTQTELNVHNGTSFEPLSGSVLYDNVISKFYNRNKIYIDLRNEHDDSLNYYENYSNSIHLSLDNSTNHTVVDYYRTGWPIFVVDASEFDVNNQDKIIKLALARGDNESPLVYYRRVYKETLGFTLPKGTEQFYTPAIANNLFPIEDLVTDNNATHIFANYYNIKIIRRINIENDGNGDYPLQGYSLFKRSYLDNLFPIFDIEIPFTNENYTNLKIYYDAHYVDKVLISQQTINNNLSDYTLRDYTASIGIASDQNHISFIAFPFKYHSNFDNNNDFLPLPSLETQTANPFLIELNERLSQVNLVRSNFLINDTETEYLRFENNRIFGGTTNLDEYSFDDVIIVTITRQEFQQLQQLKDQNFNGPYKVYLGVKNITTDVDDNLNRYTTFTFVLRGLTEVSGEIETLEVVSTLSSITNAEVLGFHSGHIFPIENPYISSNYGPRSLNGRTFHRGIDLVAQIAANTLGTDVVAVKSGTVTRLVTTEDGDGGGVRVRIRSQENPTIEYNYYHLIENSNSHLTLNQFVTQGTKIGEVGNTGSSTAPHLHFEIWNGASNRINPYSIFPELALLPYTRHR